MMFYGMGAAVAVRVSNFKGQDDIVNVRRSAYAGFQYDYWLMASGICGSIVFLCSAIIWEDGSPTMNEVSAMVVMLIVPNASLSASVMACR